MMNDEHDSDLQRRIAAWREEEKARTPDYERVWQRAERAAVEQNATIGKARLWPRFAAAAAAVVTLAAAGIWWTGRDRDESWDAQLAAFESELNALPAPATAPEPPDWESPTDFLLAGTDDDSNRINR